RSRLARDAEHAARLEREAHAAHGLHEPLVGREGDRQVLDLEQRLAGHARTRVCLGSSASRRPSPTKLTARMMITSTAEGKAKSHHSVVAAPCPLAIRLPSETAGGWIPRPRNESADSIRIAFATVSVALTTIGPIAFGTMCRKMMRRSRAPIARAAIT